ncbi:hypothetical protein J6590_066698 [Homalodisca vitripennis]|nr:hypothetical protein J6590_066698 [Homalodisca vitripennis]
MPCNELYSSINLSEKSIHTPGNLQVAQCYTQLQNNTPQKHLKLSIFHPLITCQYALLQNSDCLFTRVSKVQLAGGDVWHTPYCNTSLQIAQCRMQCQSDTLSDLTNLSNSQVISHYQFWMFTSLLVFSWIGMAVVVSVGDAICFTILGDQPGKYGNQRMWGSVGFGLCVIVAGWLVDTWSAGMAHKDYTPVFYMMAVMLTLDFVVSSKIKYTQTPQAASILRNVGKMFKDIQVLVFLLWLVVVGMCTALIWNFLFWYLEELADNYGCSVTQQWIKTLEGLVNGVQCFGGEIPFFFLSGWILKKIGHTHAMSLVLFAFSIRFLLYSTLTNPWWCLPIEMLNGLTFGLLYATMASYASLVAPPGTDTTVQGLVGAIFEGIGVSMGSFLAGLMFDQMSGAMVFRISGLAVLVLCVLHICAQFFISRRHILVVASGKESRTITGFLTGHNVFDEHLRKFGYFGEDSRFRPSTTNTTSGAQGGIVRSRTEIDLILTDFDKDKREAIVSLPRKMLVKYTAGNYCQHQKSSTIFNNKKYMEENSV